MSTMGNANNSVNERVHLAISPWDLTDDYNRHAGVTLLSFLDHCSLPVTAHILYDEKLSVGKEDGVEFNKQCYQEIANRYGCELVYHHVELPEWIYDVPAIKKWTPGTLLRLYLPELLPGIGKIIYLDCDMVVTADMHSLWEIPLGDAYLAAVPDSARDGFGRRRNRYYNSKNIPIDSYFCAGALVLNLDKLRIKNQPFSNVVFDFLKENRDLPYLDQDLLNWFCQGNYIRLDEKYNIYAGRKDDLKFAPDCIIHYASSEKPWKRYKGELDDYYWHYLVETPWAKNKQQLISYVREAPVISRCYLALPVYYYAQEGVPYTKSALMVFALSLRLPVKVIGGFLVYLRGILRKRGLL